MLAQSVAPIIAQHTNMPLAEVIRMLALDATAVRNDAAYQQLLQSLDADQLEETLQVARAAFNNGLQPIADEIQTQYNLDNNPMSAYTLGNWLVGFAESPDQLAMFQGLHTHLPKQMMATYLPSIIGVLDNMGEGREVWQHSIAVLAISLITGA